MCIRDRSMAPYFQKSDSVLREAKFWNCLFTFLYVLWNGLFTFLKKREGGKIQILFLKKGFTLPLYISISGAAIVIHCQFWVVLLKLVDVFVGACRFLVVRLFYSASCVGFQLGLRVFPSGKGHRIDYHSRMHDLAPLSTIPPLELCSFPWASRRTKTRL